MSRTPITQNIIANEILNALLSSNGLDIAVFLESKYGISKKEYIQDYMKRLKSDGYITYHTLPNGSYSSYISPSGEKFIKAGGYPPDVSTIALQLITGKEKSKPETFKEAQEIITEKATRAAKESVKSNEEIKFFLTAIREVKESIDTKIGVMGDDELAPVYSVLRVRFTDFYGKESSKTKRILRFKSSPTYKRKLVPFLVEIITELELELQRTNPKTKKNLFEGLGTSNAEMEKQLNITAFSKDNKLLNYVLNECEKIRKQLSELEYSDNVKLAGLHKNLGTLLKKIYPDNKNPHLKLPGVLNRDSLIFICDEVRQEIEIELLGQSHNFSNLHPKVIELSSKQFNDKHYREAVLNAFVGLIEVVKDKYPLRDNNGKLSDGKDLMLQVFSAENPKLKFSDSQEEQRGIMFLYAGSAAALRNKYAHKTNKITDEAYAFELLHFASALFRLIDNPGLY